VQLTLLFGNIFFKNVKFPSAHAVKNITLMSTKDFMSSNKVTSSNPFVFFSKAAFMQRISDLVRTGHSFYVMGELPIEKVAGFYSKMNDYYLVDEGKHVASRKRKDGFASFRLFLGRFNAEDPNVTFIMVRTDGVVPALANKEKWRDALVDKIQLTGYELVRHTRKDASKPSWSWRYTKQQEIDLRDSLVSSIRRKSDKDLSYLISQVAGTMGFAIARDQAKKMCHLVTSEWKRHRNITEKPPALPKRFGYVQRLPDVGRLLTDLDLKSIRKTKLKKS